MQPDGCEKQYGNETSPLWRPTRSTPRGFGSKPQVGFGVDSVSTPLPVSTKAGRATTGAITLTINVEWIPPAPNAAPEEAATLCTMRIFVDGKSACRFLDLAAPIEHQEHDRLTIPAVHLAEGLATDWWSILHGRDEQHRLQKYRTGFALPDLVLMSHGRHLEVLPGNRNLIKNPQLQFVPVDGEIISLLDAEAVFSGYIEDVIERLNSEGIHSSELQSRWDRVTNSRMDEEESDFCEAAGALGLDPYRISEDNAGFIESANDLFAKEVLLEFLSGLRNSNWSHNLISRLEHLDNRVEHEASLPLLTEIGQVSMGMPERPWETGFRAAQWFRDAMGLKLSDRLSYQSLKEKLRATKWFAPVELDGSLRAFVSRSENNTKIHLHQFSSIEATNFAFARAIGDAVMFPVPKRSVVNRLHHAERQAAGRSFAAELLAPIKEIIDMTANKLDMEDSDIASEFGVSDRVIRFQFENHEVNTAR